jgi:hypothetical protein
MKCPKMIFARRLNLNRAHRAKVPLLTTAKYDGWFNERDQKDQYLLIGFDLKGNPLEIMYNIIDNETISVFHAMPCRSIFYHLLPKEENYG